MAHPIPLPQPDMIPVIADYLLSDDPIDLISFRAVCHLFRSFSSNPRSLAFLHRPRHWIMLSDGGGDLTIPRSFLNLASGRSLDIPLPDLYGHSILSSVDGLLVLLHNETFIVRLFNPFTRLLVNLPRLPLKLLRTVHTRHRHSIFAEFVYSAPPLVSVAISSSENPTVVISLEKSHNVLVSKPGDQQWVVFKHWYNFQYNLLFFQGRFFSTNQQGTVCSLNLKQEQQQQHEEEEEKEEEDDGGDDDDDDDDTIIELVSPDWGPGWNRVYRSYLVESNSTLLLVRKYSSARPNGALVEVYRVNPESNTLSLVNNIGNRALFVGPTRTLSVSSEDFPCIRENSIYFGTDLLTGPVAIYSLGDDLCEPISDKTVIHNGVRKLMPSVRPFTLADHLITCCSHIQWARGLMYHEFCVFPRGWNEDDFIWGITPGYKRF